MAEMKRKRKFAERDSGYGQPFWISWFLQEFRNPMVMVSRAVLFVKLFLAGAVCLMADAPGIHLRSAVNFRQGFGEDRAFQILLSVSQHLLKLFDRDFRDSLFITRKNLCNKVIPDFRQRCGRVSNLPAVNLLQLIVIQGIVPASIRCFLNMEIHGTDLITYFIRVSLTFCRTLLQDGTVV